MNLRFTGVFILLLIPNLLSAETVAFVGLSYPGIAPHTSEQFQKLVGRQFCQAKPCAGVSRILVRERQIQKDLRQVLDQELTQARQAYYRFEFAKADALLSGRSDPEALTTLALVAQARGDQTTMKACLEKLLVRYPGYHLSKKDYPPQFVEFFASLAEPKQRYVPERTSLGGHEFSLDEIGSWNRRFMDLMKQQSWDELILLSVEPVGWNYKLMLYRLGAKPDGVHTVEVKSLSEMSAAAKILIDFVDTQGNFK